MEDADWIFCTFWDEEERVESSKRGGNFRWSTTVPKEVREGFDGERVGDEKHCPQHRSEMGVEFMVMGVHITEGLF